MSDQNLNSASSNSDVVLQHNWVFRKHNEPFKLTALYGQNPTYFTLKFHHGGEFTKIHRRTYVKGEVMYVDRVDGDTFSVHEVDQMILELGYQKEQTICYHFRVPEGDMDSGLQALVNDDDVRKLLQYVDLTRIIEIYIEHYATQLSSSVIFEDNIVDDAYVPSMVVYQPGVPNQVEGEYITVDEQVLREFEMGQLWNEDDNTMENQRIDLVEHAKERVLNEDVEEKEVDPEYIYDDTQVRDVPVDMTLFRRNIDMVLHDESTSNVSAGPLFEFDLNGFDSLDDSDDELPLDRAVREIRTKNKQIRDSVSTTFYVGQVFASRSDIRHLVKKLAVDSRRQLSIIRNDTKRFRVVCYGRDPGSLVVGKINEKVGPSEKAKEVSSDVECSSTCKKIDNPKPTCPWVLHVSRKENVESWVVKTFINNHNCLHTREVRLCTLSWIAKDIEETVLINPTIPLSALQDQVQKKYQISVSKYKVFRAKSVALKKIQGDYALQYTILRDYCEELLRSNPGTTIKIEVENCCNPASPTRQFKRIYICLGPLKEGFKLLGRELLGLDGCFMKGPFPGQILTAVGIDSNNGIYPVAYALVEAETLSSWTWFLECLGDDIGLCSQSNFTFISDRQKGLIPALTKVFPNAEHRYCLRHIHENMTNWRGQLFKDMLWKCAISTTPQQYDKAMKEIQEQDQGLYDWLIKIPPKHWSRAHFSGRAKSDVLLNNLCEVLNRQLLGGRDKPIITCLEFIREYLMKRIVNVQLDIEKCSGPLHQ
ncbi:putative transposase, mutator type, transposase, MuDR, plant, MULE transposase [Helianthus annuus]|nr:putative transposase, mutator type, transposase, MuDR, plant, MULE transposase [Helianthus annuus]KAJ0869398.1 putative transposase, mutator type, transposase, MuDR, plant, MULE transposase [Helianthus annuus]